MENKYYNIILLSNGLCMCSCLSEEIAQNRLKEIIKNDLWLANYYKWNKMPKYAIVESERRF